MKHKIRILSFLFVVAMLITSTVAYGATEFLWKSTNTTYVKTTHGDNYFADTYNGEASVRGKDRDLINGRNVYFKWTKITYDVQGTQTSGTAYSNGKNDARQVRKSITAKDKWNNGSKTKAYYNYATGIVDGNLSIDDTQIFNGTFIFDK